MFLPPVVKTDKSKLAVKYGSNGLHQFEDYKECLAYVPVMKM